MENINALLIEKGIAKAERFNELTRIAQNQLKTLDKINLIKSLKKESDRTYIEAQKKK